MRALLLSLLLAVPAAAPRAAEAGAAIFANRCQACHQPAGEGLSGIAPPLAGTLARRAETEEGRALLARTVVHGLSGPILSRGERFNGNMPAFGALLSDDELAAVLNHVLAEWNGSRVQLTPALFAQARQQSGKAAELRQLRERLLQQTGEAAP